MYLICCVPLSYLCAIDFWFTKTRLNKKTNMSQYQQNCPDTTCSHQGINLKVSKTEYTVNLSSL